MDLLFISHLDHTGALYSVSFRSRSDPDPNIYSGSYCSPDSKLKIQHCIGGSAVDFPLPSGPRRGSALVPTEDHVHGQVLHDPRHQGTVVVLVVYNVTIVAA